MNSISEKLKDGQRSLLLLGLCFFCPLGSSQIKKKKKKNGEMMMQVSEKMMLNEG